MPTFKEKSELIHKSTENLLAVKWEDKREVHMLTSYHSPDEKGLGNGNGNKKTNLYCRIQWKHECR